MTVYSHGALFVLLVCLHYAETYGPYIGCYKDDKSRVMVAGTANIDKVRMTIGLCEQHCRSTTSYTFLGTQFGMICFCGDSYNRYGNASESECNTTCKGDPTQKCGSDWRISVYAVCQAGSWGKDCDQPCNCEVCMRISGICSSPCFAGWLGASCDVPACTNNNGDCEHICNQTSDDTWCSCLSGYYLNADEKGCSDINECVNGSHQCSAGDYFCVNTQGGYCCSCPEGYGLQKDSHTCADINECVNDSHQCTAGDVFFKNNAGSYSCSCPEGYRLEDDNHACADVDECSEGLHQCSEGIDMCHNIEGNYTCSCPRGYTMEKDNRTCTGECERRFHLTLPRSSNLESRCKALETLHNVTLTYSTRMACKIGGNVIATIFGVYVIKICHGKDMELVVTNPGGGWDIYQQNQAELVATTVHEIQGTGADSSQLSKSVEVWVIATSAVVPCMILALMITAIYLIRRHSICHAKPKEQSAEQQGKTTVKELTDMTSSVINSSVPLGIYEEINEASTDPNQQKKHAETPYCNIVPGEKVNGMAYQSLNEEDIENNDATVNEYEFLK